MAALQHPMSGAVYRVREDGLVDVENNGLTGVFQNDGRYVSGPQLPASAQFNRRLVKPGSQSQAEA